MTRLLICAALALVLQICAAHGQAENPVKALAEHWRCGPYRLTITPDADLDFPNMVDFLDYKNGRDAGHTTNRARLTSTEDGARSVWWEGFTGATGSGDSQRWKYDAGGEIVTRNGASYYKEWVTGGKTGRELSYARHQCKKIAGPELIHSRMPVPLPRSRPWAGSTDAIAESHCLVQDPTGTPLNVRATPNGHIVGTLNNGDEVTVLDHTSDRRGKTWVYVGNYEDNKPIGWVFREFIACGVEQVPAIRPRSRDDAAQQNSRICFDPGSSHDERELGCSAVIESGHESGRTLSMAFCNRGHALIEKQEYDRAIADLNQAIVIDPGFACSYNNRGRAFGFKGDDDRALADYNQAVRLDPKFALAYNNRADVWLHRGDLGRAIDDLSTAIRLDSKFVLAYANRGSIFRDMRKFDNAIADYS
jgi:Bacterial SH3 domain/Tetratricopeptide repeat